MAQGRVRGFLFVRLAVFAVLAATPVTAVAVRGAGEPQPSDGADPQTDWSCEERAGRTSSLTANPNALTPSDWGEVTVAQPKIWQFERVDALLDGLLRDIEGVSLADLVRLDPNAQNAAAVQFVQSALQVGANFDQGAALTNRAAADNYSTQRQAANDYNAYRQQLTQRRIQAATDLVAANTTIATLQPLKDAKVTLTDQQEQDLAAANSRAAQLSDEIPKLNALIGDSSATATPSVTATKAGDRPQSLPTPSGLGDLIKSLPDSVQKSLATALQAPNLPATKQLDNFLTVLQERLARQVSVLNDDLMRDPNNLAFLVQFDVGLYPSGRTSNHMARVEFDLYCPRCKVYSLYPGQASYNVANFDGASRRNTLWGGLASLFGFGISAAYQRQEDSLRGSLVQSVYTSAFLDASAGGWDAAKNAEQRFGWYYNAAPFERYVTPGIRSTFAIITVPRTVTESDKLGVDKETCIPFRVKSAWTPRDNPNYRASHAHGLNSEIGEGRRQFFVSTPLPGTLGERLPKNVIGERDRLHVMRLEYRTRYHATSTGTTPTDAFTNCPQGECASVMLTLDVPIDPNMVVTVNGRPLTRIRDWRGRATSVLPPAQSLSDTTSTDRHPTSRALLESDGIAADSWFPVSSHELMVNISRGLAGESEFPTIRLTDPGRRTFVVPNDLRRDFTELLVNGFRIVPRTESDIRRYAVRSLSQCVETKTAPNDSAMTCAELRQSATADTPLPSAPYAFSTFVPLFLPDRGAQPIGAFVGETGEDLLIQMQGDSARSRAWQETRTQVILEDRDQDFAWSLTCTIQDVYLACRIPRDALRKTYLTLNEVCQLDTDCPAIRQTVRWIWQSFQISASPGSGFATQSRGHWRPAVTAFKLNPGILYVPNLQLWVEQWDPSNAQNAFYSPQPVPFGLFPLLANQTSLQSELRQWHVESADLDKMTLRECRLVPTGIGQLAGAFLGAETDEDASAKVSALNDCVTLDVPTRFMERREVVLRLQNNQPGSDAVTVVLPTRSFEARFSRVRVTKNRTVPTSLDFDSWTVRFQADNLLCGDTVRLGSELVKAGASQTPLGMPSAACRELEIKLPRESLGVWPQRFDVVRTTSAQRDVVMGSLPDLRSLLLPTKLTLEALGDKQLLLRGDNAAVIDGLLLKGPSGSWTFAANATGNAALVDLSKPLSSTKTVVKPAAKTNAAGRGGSPGATAAKAQPTPTPTPTPAPLEPGIYALEALTRYQTNSWLPLDIAGEAGTTLTYTLAAPKEQAGDAGAKLPADKITTVTTRTIEKAATPAK